VSEKLRGWEALILWALLAEGGKSYWNPLVKKKMISKDHAADREALARARLITSEKRPGKGKGLWIEVTDEGWRRAGENLTITLPITQTASAVFQAWLTRLQTFMDARDLVLADILGPQHSTHAPASRPESIAPSPSAPVDYSSVRNRVRKAYLDLSGGHLNTRVLLSDLRENLEDLERHKLDEALKRMHLEEGTTLSGLNNPQEVTQVIRDAGISFKGEPMYVLWITK
jgi:hypothetical protein